MTDLLAGRTAVVTGGSSGIGRGISKAMAEHGADVVIADLRSEPRGSGVPTHELIEAETDSRAGYVECDVTDLEDLKTAVDAAGEFGGIDTMVNNVGIFELEDPLDVSEDHFQRFVNINVKTAYFGTQIAATRMVENDVENGNVINLSSMEGIEGSSYFATYSTTKGAVRLLTYSFASRLGAKGIRVNAIHPGGVDTEAVREMGGDPDGMETFVENIPLGRIADPSDIGGAAVLLASDLANYVTGESLLVDGGFTNTITGRM